MKNNSLYAKHLSIRVVVFSFLAMSPQILYYLIVSYVATYYDVCYVLQLLALHVLIIWNEN